VLTLEARLEGRNLLPQGLAASEEVRARKERGREGRREGGGGRGRRLEGEAAERGDVRRAVWEGGGIGGRQAVDGCR